MCFFRCFPAVPVPTQVLLSKWLWSCPLAHYLFSLWLCRGGWSWNSLLHINKPWQISKYQTSDLTFNPCFLHAHLIYNPCFMHVFTSSYLLHVLCISFRSNHLFEALKNNRKREQDVFAPHKFCCAVIHTLRIWFTCHNCSTCKLIFLSESMILTILTNIYNDGHAICPYIINMSVILFWSSLCVFSDVFRLFPFPRKHSWASGSEAVPWLTTSSTCGFAVEDAAGIASCTSTNPGKSANIKLRTWLNI